jgi:hypothetical protein
MAEKKTQHAYESLLSEHKLKVSDLSEDAQTGIAAIKDIETGFRLQEKKGKKPTAAALKKVAAWDKSIVREIVDMLEEQEPDNKAELEEENRKAQEEADRLAAEAETKRLADEEVARIEAEKNKTATTEPEFDPIAAEIDLECVKMKSNSKEKIDMNYLREHCPNIYKLIFDTYEKGKPNGVTTSHFSVLETDVQELFELKKL